MTTTLALTDRFVRTEAGKAEIRTPVHALSRPARNLLLVIDASCSGLDWVAKVHGSQSTDLQRLIEAGLVAPASTGGPAVAGPRVSLDEALRHWTHDDLYQLLTHEARERFGLIKGYRLVLRIEACSGLPELQAVAREFAGLLAQAHGEEAAARFRQQLGARE